MGIVRAHAKINLTLDVLDRRPDGYHNISSVMQTISLHDVVQVELTQVAGEIRVTVNGPYAEGVPTDSRNLVHKAAKALLDAIEDHEHGVVIHISKMIPSQAGLGGGSSDAAATLVELNRLLGRPFQHQELVPIAATIGSDVPFLIFGGTCLAEGIGEKVTVLPSLSYLSGILIKPPMGVSTAAAYAALDTERSNFNVNVPPEWDRQKFRNDFEPVVYTLYPEVKAARDALIDSGCSQAVLCGSGSAVFGLCKSEDAFAILEQMRAFNLGDCFFVRSQDAV